MTSRPTRIQRRRAAGWRMPAGAVYVGRPGKWGNPWRIGLIACTCGRPEDCTCNAFRVATAAEAVARYRGWLNRRRRLLANLVELQGRDLACWCPLDRPCHADVLLHLANR